MMKRNLCVSALIGTMAALTAPAFGGDVIGAGISAVQDGSFNYQGYLEFEGAPANGDYFFEVHLLDSNGDEIDPLFDELGPITVTDGLFDMDIQMGGLVGEAEYFWERYGHLAKSMRIMVGLIEGGPYTTLSPDVDLGASPHAMWSRFAQALQFPYTDSHANLSADPETMISLNNNFGGTVLDLTVNVETNEPTLLVRGQNTFDDGIFGQYAGELQVNNLNQFAGVVAMTQGFAILGELVSNSGTNTAAVLGEVNSTSNPSGIAVWALNQASGNDAALGTGTYSGDFNHDVIVRDNLRVQDEITRDYAANSPSPVGPLAYGSVSSTGALNSGTANISSSWDAANSRYVIDVAGEFVTFALHTVSVTVVDSNEPRVATFNTGSGDIHVKIWDLNSGNVATQDNFSIVIHDPGATVLSRMAVPDGVDLDKYSEKTGAQLIQTQPRHEPVEAFENYGSGVTGD